MKQWPRVREVVLLFGGLAGIFYEAVFQESSDPVLIALYAGMIGLAPFLHKDGQDKP